MHCVYVCVVCLHSVCACLGVGGISMHKHRGQRDEPFSGSLSEPRARLAARKPLPLTAVELPVHA